MAITVTVAGVDRTKYMIRDGSFAYTRQFAATGVLNATFKDRRRSVSTWRPAVDDTIVVLDGATTVFTGIIIDVQDTAYFEPGFGTETRVTARDQMRFPDQRIVSNQTFASGQTLKQVLTSLNTTYLSGFSVTVDAGMASGPTLDEQNFDNVSLSQVFRHLMDVTGYVIYITSGLVLKAFSPGSVSASFSLTEANNNARGTLTWRQTRGKYVNTVYLIAGPNQQIEKTDTLTGTGAVSVFPLRYDTPVVNNGVLLSRGYVIENGAYVTLSATGGGASWTYDAATNSVTRAAGALGLGILATITYTVQFPIVVSDTDAAEVAAKGNYDDTIRDENITDIDAAETAVAGYLARYKTAPQTIDVETRQSSGELGQSITLTFANRGVSSTALITGIKVYFLPKTQTLKYALTCLDGTQAQGSWIDYFRGLVGGASGSGSGGIATGNLIPAPSGVFSADVVANMGSDGNPFEASLRAVHTNASVQGPALQLGRDLDEWRWFIVANTLNGTPPGDSVALEFISGKDSSTYRRAMMLRQTDTPVAGEYYLLPSVTGKLTIGAAVAAFGGSTSIEAVYANKYFEGTRSAAAGYYTSFTPTLTASAGNWNSATVTRAVYRLAGKEMRVEFYIQSSNVTAAPADLIITIPGSFVSAGAHFSPTIQTIDAGAGSGAVGIARVAAAGTEIRLQSTAAGGGWTTTAGNNTTVRGFIEFEVQ